MQEVSLHQLSDDKEAWPEEIVQKFKERIPQSEGMSLLVRFMKQDEETGTATGSIEVSNTRKRAIVPLIIKDTKMYPLDVFMVDKHLLPLTPDYFDAVFSDNFVFQRLEEYPMYGGLGRFEEGNLWNATYPPSLGRYAYASGPYPILEEIADTIDGSKIAEYLKANPGVAIKLAEGQHYDVVKKVAAARPQTLEKFREAADQLIPRDLEVLVKVGRKTIKMENSSTFFAPRITTAPTADLRDLTGNSEKLTKVPKSHAKVLIEDPTNKTPTRAHDIKEYGLHEVKYASGYSAAVVIPKVIDFNMNPIGDVLVIGEKMASLQPRVAGIKKEAQAKLETSDFRPGDTGTFVFEKNGRALATIPVTIKVASQTPEGRYIDAVDAFSGKPYRFKYAGDIKKIAAIHGTHYIPDGFKWVRLPEFNEVAADTHGFNTKIAAQQRTTNPVKLIHTGYDQYCMKGVDKYASACGWNPDNLWPHEARFLLYSLGAVQEKVAKAFQVAKTFGACTLHGLNRPELKSEKIAAAVPRAEEMKKAADGLRVDIEDTLKLAGYVENSQTVDTLLSLNFINPENLAKFVGKLPALKACISTLADLLVASRLGIKEIPEHAASTSMMRLVDVVNGLEALRATQEQKR